MIDLIPNAGAARVPTSQQMRDAGAELAARISHGEYDDLDEYLRHDLEWLAAMLRAWACRVGTLESGGMESSPATQDRCQ